MKEFFSTAMLFPAQTDGVLFRWYVSHQSGTSTRTSPFCSCCHVCIVCSSMATLRPYPTATTDNKHTTVSWWNNNTTKKKKIYLLNT
jgi:hypothetical protein